MSTTELFDVEVSQKSEEILSNIMMSSDFINTSNFISYYDGRKLLIIRKIGNYEETVFELIGHHGRIATMILESMNLKRVEKSIIFGDHYSRSTRELKKYLVKSYNTGNSSNLKFFIDGSGLWIWNEEFEYYIDSWEFFVGRILGCFKIKTGDWFNE